MVMHALETSLACQHKLLSIPCNQDETKQKVLNVIETDTSWFHLFRLETFLSIQGAVILPVQ